MSNKMQVRDVHATLIIPRIRRVLSKEIAKGIFKRDVQGEDESVSVCVIPRSRERGWLFNSLNIDYTEARDGKLQSCGKIFLTSAFNVARIILQ